MIDLADYFSDKEKIIRLNKQIILLQKNNSKWKRKYENLNSSKPTIRKNRTSKAEVLVRSFIKGDRSLTFREMAKKCFLSIETIKNISYKLRHAA